MSDFKLKGKIKLINETQVISNSFSKRDFVITTEHDTYPQDIIFQGVQDKCTILDSYKIGENVEVSFNLKGREWTSPKGEVKYFNTLDCWRIEKAQGIAGQYKQGNIEKRFEDDAIQSEADQLEDDLPF